MYEERLIGWRKRFVLYEDRIEVSFNRFLGNRGSATIQIADITSSVEKLWVKDHNRHIAVMMASLVLAGIVSSATAFLTPLCNLGVWLLALPIAVGAIGSLLYMAVDPRRIEHHRIWLATGSYVSISAAPASMDDRDGFLRAIAEQASKSRESAIALDTTSERVM